MAGRAGRTSPGSFLTTAGKEQLFLCSVGDGLPDLLRLSQTHACSYGSGPRTPTKCHLQLLLNKLFWTGCLPGGREGRELEEEDSDKAVLLCNFPGRTLPKRQKLLYGEGGGRDTFWCLPGRHDRHLNCCPMQTEHLGRRVRQVKTAYSSLEKPLTGQASVPACACLTVPSEYIEALPGT